MRESRSKNTISHVCFARFLYVFFLLIKLHPLVYRATLVSFRKLGYQEMGYRPVRHTININLFKIGIDHGNRLVFCFGSFCQLQIILNHHLCQSTKLSSFLF